MLFTRAIRSAALLALVPAIIASCARSTPASGTPGRGPPLDPSPSVRGAESGLEVWWWIVRESDDRPLVRPLRAYLDRPVPVPPGLRSLWQANGLRLVAVPLVDLDAVQQSLRLAGPQQRHWLGQPPRWTPIASGPAWSGSLRLLTDQGPLSLDDGRLRLLTRAWIVPGVPEGHSTAATPASFWIELLLQHLDASHTGPASGSGLARGLEQGDASDDPIEASGLVFSRLALAARMPPGDALLIIPEWPDADWSRDPDPSAAPPPVSGGVDWPETPRPGQALLTDALASTTARTRVILVLAPRFAPEFRLIAARATDPAGEP